MIINKPIWNKKTDKNIWFCAELNEEYFEKKMKSDSQDNKGDRTKILTMLLFMTHPLQVKNILFKYNKKVVSLVSMISSIIYGEMLKDDQFYDPCDVLCTINFHIVFSIIKRQTIQIIAFSTYSRNNSVIIG